MEGESISGMGEAGEDSGCNESPGRGDSHQLSTGEDDLSQEVECEGLEGMRMIVMLKLMASSYTQSRAGLNGMG